MKLLFFTIILIIFFIYSFFNLGNFLDVTQEPSKTDLVVCLGGNKDRIFKALELYEKRYLLSNKIILTGYENPKSYNIKSNETEDLRFRTINQKMYSSIDFIYKNELKSTAEEILFVKEYMKNNNFNTVTFITENPHSRRVKFLFDILDNKISLKANIVSSNYEIWNSNKYYLNKHTLIYSLLECLKIFHNIIFYKLFANSLLLENVKIFLDTNKPEFTTYLRNIF